ncbi:MAG: hypothetical protein A2W90_06055 [Bacteroidetes bacterium GWF2_42_66]|nr:MAG: hypothetical protein A2W92_01435 [Bacteroidetes bacterium GWA2_42_15]OFY03605.1 MAG: hypothetical protein A2W89_18780 [Bacteroidetes bacterium GWE2_42_39]OFY45970.1 MAG: hypothetical protein A2W90_06055 [Bacteroidetes bacterium GWF2_42_66]HBL75214.1 hypothetical protein [Prolixibacteraceae bacterium]HCR90803.1 hypothetical protein [Prolixibacteraceae bacterium]
MSGFTQKKDYLEIQAIIFVGDDILEGTTLDMEVNSKETQHFEISRDPKFVYRLKFNNEYKLTFSKPGLYTRIILISTQVPKTILDVNSDFPPVEFQVNLFKEVEDVDKSFSFKPYARIFYDKASDDFLSEVFVNDNLFAIQLDQALAKEKEVNKEQKSLDKLELQELQEMQKEYDRIVKEADGFFDQTKYQEALAKYKEAGKFFPDRPYPQDRIREIQNLLDALKLAEQKKQDLNKLYKEAIDRADAKFQDKLYDDALAAYRQAMQYKPDDNYAQRKISEIGQIVEQRDKATKFAGTLARAENLFSSKDYAQAREVFREASVILPEDPRPNARIEEINRILQQVAQQTASKQNYQKALQDGDRLFGQQKFTDAIAQYRTALEIKTNDPAALEKIRNAESAIQQLQNQQNYDAAIVGADKAFRGKDYQLAETEYRKALSVKPEEKYPKEQLDRIAGIMADESAEKLKTRQYASLVRSGDSLMGIKNYKDARGSFVKAKNLFPQEKYPEQMILQIDKELKDVAAREAQQQQVNIAYTQAISRADQAFVSNQYDLAKMAYNEALGIKPDEKYPSSRIEEINRILQEEKGKAYQQAIAGADRLFDRKEYAAAVDEYRKALLIKGGDSYANGRIAEATRFLETIAAENARMKKLDDDYNRLLVQAADAARRNDLGREREKLTEALALKPTEIYPKNRISEIDDILGKQRIAEENERLYAENMKAGQKAFNEERLTDAKSSFEEALKYKTGNQLALQRIEEINKILAQRAEIERLAKLEEQQRLEAEKANREKYNQIIALADADFVLKKYNEARDHYVSAISAIPGEQYPKDKIKEIDDILDELKMQTEVSKQQAIRDSTNKARLQNYQLLVKQAEQLASGKKYEDAISKYNEALEIIPENRTDINSRITNLKDQMRIAEKQLADYLLAIEKADGLFNLGKYTEALPLYVDAGNSMPNEEYPKNQIRKIQDIIDKKNAEYVAFIEKADEYFNQEKWQSAKNNYADALGVKPNDEYAMQQVQLVNQKISIMLAGDVEKSVTNKAFTDMLKQADGLLAAGKLNEARDQYEIAKTLKPEDPYPDQKIGEIIRMIDTARSDSLRLAQAKNEDDRYRQVIALADQSFRDKVYEEAVSRYENALQIKPGEAYPKKQIDLIRKMMQKTEPVLAETKKPDAVPAETKPVQTQAQAEYLEASPRYLENLSITETNKLYDEIIGKADDMFTKKDYSVARFHYYKASDIKPAEAYPRQRIEEIGRLIDVNLSDDIRSAYDSAIKQADDAFMKSNYTVAKFYYYKALEVKSWERYPKDRIHEIQVLTNTLLSEREQRLYNEAIAQADEAYYAKNYSVSRFHYNEASRINPEERYPKIKIEDIKKLLEQEKRDQVRMEYMNQLRQADQAFEQGNFSVARFYYNKALVVQKDEQYPKDQLKRIEEALSKRSE